MKKIYSLSFVLLSTLGFAQTYIPFTGTGALNANGWTTHSGTAGQQTIVANSLSYTGLAASTGNKTSVIAGNTEDVNFAFAAPITVGPVYYSALVNVLDAAQLNLNTATGDYSLALTSVASASTTVFQARIYIKQGATAGTFVAGILNNSGGTAAPTYAATDLAVNTTHFFVVKYDLTTNTASLFINPVPGSTEPAATVTNATGTTAAPTQSAGFVIRQGGNATAGTGNVEYDEIRVNTTWAGVTPNTLSLNESAIAGFSISPNPVNNGVFYITTDASAERKVTMYDVLGKVVLTTTTTDNAVNVAGLNAGVYMVQVTEEGKTATKKLVIR